jgi:carboxymethylenebutenolidase
MNAITHDRLSVSGGLLPLTVARSGARGAAIVVMPSAFGVGRDLEAQMRELASDARLVVAFDPFFRTDAGPAPYDDMARVMTRVRSLERARAEGDLVATLEWARAQASSVVMLGICVGGPFALFAAAEGLVAGGATWHGTGMEHHLERAADIRCPLRLHFGDADPFVPPSAVERVRSAFAHHADVEVVVHAGATHGFSHREAARAHDPAAERSALESLRALAR